MIKVARKDHRRARSGATISAEEVAALAARLRDLPAAAGPDEVRALVGDDAAAIGEAARALGRIGDDAAIAALDALRTVPAFALPAIEALGRIRDEAAVQVLQQAAASPTSREAGKAARRALHALAGSGMAVTVPTPASNGAIYLPPPAEGVTWSSALGGPIDSAGTRSLLLGQKRLPVGAAIAIGVVSETSGILYFQTASQTHRQLDKDWQVFLEERPETLSQEIPFPFAQWLLGEAADQMTEAGRDVPEECTAWFDFTGGRPTTVSPQQIYAEAEVEAASPPVVTVSAAGALLAEPEIEPWTLPFESVSGYGADLLSARNSPIVLSEDAAMSREHRLAARAADEQFTAEVRHRYRRRLEETALLFLRSDRADRARAALATAIALGDSTVTPAEIPFVVALTLRAIETAAEVEAPTTDEGQAARTLLLGADQGAGTGA